MTDSMKQTIVLDLLSLQSKFKRHKRDYKAMFPNVGAEQHEKYGVYITRRIETIEKAIEAVRQI